MPKPRKGEKNKEPIKPTFRIFCEGEKTEPQYFRALIDDLFPGKRNLVVVEDCKPNTPREIVETAAQSRKVGHANDVVWVVYDREAVNKYPHQLHKDASDLAKSNDIGVAISNICFEYWLLLHFEQTDAQYGSYADLIKNSNLKEHFSALGLDYDKATPQIYETIKDSLDKAMRRATITRRNSHQAAEQGKQLPHYLNPFVNIDELINEMRGFVATYG
ncbi:RloB family protein [Alteromonas halophila]|uniref:RloB domain-containing protein n=1 Tax=Alteromonas halophila TaxID=516698 RepID=A0A918JRB8_9ALTE|nr:RloB family protein [Alteromonas halophila]GGW97915.1 hypothetical protein GCM10007391_34920 [Alteromonas halophila]